MIPRLGEFVALLTALLWAFTSIFFALASQRAGSQVVNRARLLLATGFLSLAHRLLQGQFFPTALGLDRWGWLTLSAVTGLVLGDGLLFYAFTQIGPRLSMLLMATVPVISTFLAWIFLGEVLHAPQLLAIAITVTGVAWVVLERQSPTPAASPLPRARPRAFTVGVLCGLGAAIGQALGLILSKEGMNGGFPALSASLIRVTTATVIIWIVAAFQGEAGATLKALGNAPSRNLILGGTLFGPVFGMTLSLVAVQASAVGIASALMALSPVLLLPLARWQFQERISARAALGTLAALGGGAMIFLL